MNRKEAEKIVREFERVMKFKFPEKVRIVFVRKRRGDVAWSSVKWELRGNKLVLHNPTVYFRGYRTPSLRYKYPDGLVLVHELLELYYYYTHRNVSKPDLLDTLPKKAHVFARRRDTKIWEKIRERL